MRGVAFCPAHVTAFFGPVSGADELRTGSVGAGFAVSAGVRTAVEAREAAGPRRSVRVCGRAAADTAVSDAVISAYDGIAGAAHDVRAVHEAGVPVGYGLGSSAAVALSLSLALNEALGTGLSRERAAQVAHAAEIRCRTGLGDVAGALDGGMEVRVSAGAPGVARVRRADSASRVVIACYAPVDTRRYIADRLRSINGLGGRMASELRSPSDAETLQSMSARFAGHIGAITPRMRGAMRALGAEGIACGVALLGQTVFALVADDGSEARALGALGPFGGEVIRARIDNEGARVEG
ncbi:MAG: GHMP kinase [Thaumarchaeota archaeon]|nr:GHMP kinase [Nitrososphaerota archaeon]